MDSGAIMWGFVQGWLQALVIAWPLVLGLVVIHGGKFAYRLYEKKRLSQSGVADIDRMDGRTFDKYLETLFERLGYRVELTRYVGDYGADLVVQKDGVKTVIQGSATRAKWASRACRRQ